MLADEYDAYANVYMNPHDLGAWANTELESVLKGFWSAVKGNKDLDYGVKKVYLTGVTPLLLSSLTSGFNEQENLTFDPDFSTICGLTRSDVLGALQVICTNKEEVQERLEELEFYANGYHFCDQRRVETVFNTQTALSYLQVSKQNYCMALLLIIWVCRQSGNGKSSRLRTLPTQKSPSRFYRSVQRRLRL